MDPIELAIEDLAKRGIVARRTDEPFLELYDVTGYPELTRGQVLDLASRLSHDPYAR